MSYVPPPSAKADAPVPNHLAWAIIATVLATCLCCPLGLVGIVAIVFAAKVNNLLAAGDFEGAQRASANAKTGAGWPPAWPSSACCGRSTSSAPAAWPSTRR